MTSDASPQPERRFVPDVLPWVIAAAALAVYLATLNPWLTLRSLPVVAKITGWDWQPMILQPALFLVTCPFRVLPPSWVPVALNLFTAVGAALTLALLARSVALWPHDRLEEQAGETKHALWTLPNGWVPPVLAAVTCGLQLSFWENAVAASGEMLDLLLFAYTIRCLLEYGVRKEAAWLNRAALVGGIGVANSWALAGFVPLFLLALAWLRGLRFFSRRFLVRTALFGLAGLALLLVLPVVYVFSSEATMGFREILRFSLGSYAGLLRYLVSRFFSYRPDAALLLGLLSLLPVLVMSIRWRTFAGGDSATTFGVSTFTFHVSHAFLLWACVWMAFDPPFSPGQIGRQAAFGLSFLTLFYLGALCVGYYSGYFLVRFGARSTGGERRRSRPPRFGRGMVRRHVYAVLVLAAAGLVYKNLPAIQARNQPHLQRYAELAAQSLPPEGGVVLSDDWVRLTVLQAFLARGTKPKPCVFLDTQLLPWPAYQASLRRRYSHRWPKPPAGAGSNLVARAKAETPLDVGTLIGMVTSVARSNRVFYLHPSFGYYFEQFYGEPRGLLYELKLHASDRLDRPPFTATELDAGEAFWKRATETAVDPLLHLMAQAEHPAGFRGRFMEFAHLPRLAPADARVLGVWYGSVLNFWGVVLQRSGRLAEAKDRFELVRQLNPDNRPAELNLECNHRLQAGQRQQVVYSPSIEDQFGKYRDWNQIMRENGPFDEPSFCYYLGLTFIQAGLRRQGGQQLERVAALAPGDVSSRLVLGALFRLWQMPDQALAEAAQIRAEPSLQPLRGRNEAGVVFLEASVYLDQTNLVKAGSLLQSLLAEHPGDMELLSDAALCYADHHCYSNAFRLVDRQLRLTPDNVSALFTKGFLHIRAGEYANAIPPLTRVLSLTNSYPALFNRAIANLHAGRLDAAEADYLKILDALPKASQVYFGLADIAFRRKEAQTAIRYYRGYLSNAVPGTAEVKFVGDRLAALELGLQ